MKNILFLLFLLLLSPLQSQELSNLATISLLTNGPIPQIFQIYRHSALRLKYPENKMVWIYDIALFKDLPSRILLAYLSGNLTIQPKIVPFDH